MLIALSGGSPAEREAIADRLVSSGKGQFVAYAQAEPKASYDCSRARILREALPRLSRGSRRQQAGLVIVHCLTEKEAVVVRASGGVIWHLYSRPSALVVIRNGDVMVADVEHGYRHIFAPLEALSEVMLSRPGGKAGGVAA